MLTRPLGYLKVGSIKIGRRHRRDLGDVTSLTKSIAELGLLHPVVVTPQKRLVAGRRRLEAVRRLGWKEVPVRVIDLDHIIQGELAENSIRRNFTPSETVAIANALESILATPVGRPRKENAGKLPGYCSGRHARQGGSILWGIGSNPGEGASRR